jgi:hypothetical protein
MKVSRTGFGALCAMALLIAGCGGGSGDGLDANGRPVGEGDDPSGPMTASFNSIQSHVFTPVCTACHSGSAAPRGLRLDATNSYAMLGGPYLDANSMTLIRQWINNGALK